jgi:hypothetical protein
MPENQRGFDVYGTAYSAKDDHVAALVQCFNEINSLPAQDHPGIPKAVGKFICKRQGDRLMIEYHLMELDLDDPSRCESFVKEIHKAVADMATDLKREFKKKTKIALKLKEDKDSAGWHREQVSLNRQWYLRVWRAYDISPEVTQSDKD